ncbi:MAG: hypothetical protein B7C24_04750 [Bacteroidetes bacterium 4572_77]|nr:MAG: hypothetical protein B7C24_04750 [Bacteroidetes bacterium 4572_77]
MNVNTYKVIISLVFFVSINLSLFAQKPIWDKYFSEDIETVQIYPPGDVMGDAFLILGDKSSKLQLTFDLFGEEYVNFEYTLIHCDADWLPTQDLLPNEYIEGYTEDYINDYEYSINTKQPYVHYKLLFPGENMKITKSGNYILKVYPEDMPNKPAFVKRIMVFDPKTSIGGKINRASDPSLRKKDQEIDFAVNIASLGSRFPSKELRVFIRQNGRWDNMIKDIQPLSISNDVMDFDLQDASNTFPGLNTFRYFDFSSMQYSSEYIYRIDKSADIDKVYLLDGKPRRFEEYIDNPDFHGQYYIETKDWPNSHVEAEYSDVFFTLNYPNPLIDGEVYIVGELTNWNITPYNKMTYNYEKKAYETTLFLKQGYYSYVYGFLPTDKKVVDVAFMEGTHYQTQNQYYVFVYYREAGTIYDQLVGVGVLKDYSFN